MVSCSLSTYSFFFQITCVFAGLWSLKLFSSESPSHRRRTVLNGPQLLPKHWVWVQCILFRLFWLVADFQHVIQQPCVKALNFRLCFIFILQSGFSLFSVFVKEKHPAFLNQSFKYLFQLKFLMDTYVHCQKQISP